MPEISDDSLLSQLKNEENAAFDYLYESCFPSVTKYIRQNTGSEQDAEDIFQESVIVLLSKIRQPEFLLTASLKTYMFSISKNLWLKKLRDSRSVMVAVEDCLPDMATDEKGTAYGNGNDLLIWLKKLTANCQRILKAIFYFNEPMESLIIKMGWKNKHTASNQKYKCIEQLRRESKK
ncbi:MULTISPECIES: RNA polymerase sigma factor [Niastella]|uniref:Sigma-70 family RNA polymerase sigma factor n=1 Tax=Niastella soli TaxID=2821487 RepID=A0ABS3Z3R6_9BACT|nr:sigma-70 family RNA polymerase sigma factor [Niastella soli]MBO9204809.1 sigma-70 family RNA polymerase sigma factor [Niastella soli]